MRGSCPRFIKDEVAAWLRLPLSILVERNTQLRHMCQVLVRSFLGRILLKSMEAEQDLCSVGAALRCGNPLHEAGGRAQHSTAALLLDVLGALIAQQQCRVSMPHSVQEFRPAKVMLAVDAAGAAWLPAVAPWAACLSPNGDPFAAASPACGLHCRNDSSRWPMHAWTSRCDHQIEAVRPGPSSK